MSGSAGALEIKKRGYWFCTDSEAKEHRVLGVSSAGLIIAQICT